MGCDISYSFKRGYDRFQSTQPEWAATYHHYRTGGRCCDFNPRSPSGLRRGHCRISDPTAQFQSTQPEWAATEKPAVFIRLTLFQSTQPEWAATCLCLSGQAAQIWISIHAARVGCDVLPETVAQYTGLISIHAARVGCDELRG